MHINAPIGVFDSGVGGLTVAREIMRQMPQERIVYFGDTARVPYGGKSKDTIIRYSRQIIHFLKTQNVKAIVVACNTASALALEEIRDEIGLPVLGVVRPGAKVASQATKNGRIGIIGTEATIRSGLYTRLIGEMNPGAEIFGQACPLFVPLVEEGLTHDFVTDEIAARYLKNLQEKGIDTLIMGCTHYPLLRSTIRRLIGEGVTLVNPAYETAIELRRMLQELSLSCDENVDKEGPKYQFFVSDGEEKFKTFADSILPYNIETTKCINIEEY